MFNPVQNRLSIFFIAVGLLFVPPLIAGSETPAQGVVVKGLWSRPAPPVAVNGAAYATLHNMGPAADRLIGARSEISERVELHNHVMNNGLMKMVHMAQGITIAAGEMVEFKPGGKHFMLLGLNKPLVEGESFQLILQFEKAGEKSMTVPIQEKPMAAGHSGHSTN